MVTATGRSGAARPLDAGPHLAQVAERLEQQDVGTAGGQAAGLLGEQVGRVVVGEQAQRLHQVAGGADAAEHQRTAGVRHLAGDAGSRLIQLVHAILVAMQRQARAGAAEGVGGEKARPGVGVGGVDHAHRVGPLDVPDLGRGAGHESGRLQHGADGAVAERRPRVSQQCRDLSHHTSSSDSRRAAS